MSDPQHDARDPQPAPRPHGADELRPRPHGADELRPRPQYGEYATPEEQRAAIRQPAEPVASVPAAPHPQPLPAAPAHPQLPHPTTRAATPSRTADRIITFALLAYGLITVISAVPQLWHFTDFAQTWMELAGIDATFTNTVQGDVWGRIGAVVFAAGWALTAMLSWRSLSRRRVTWWIPLVGAIVTFIVVSVCLTVPLLGDPAIAGTLGA